MMQRWENLLTRFTFRHNTTSLIKGLVLDFKIKSHTICARHYCVL